MSRLHCGRGYRLQEQPTSVSLTLRLVFLPHAHYVTGHVHLDRYFLSLHAQTSHPTQAALQAKSHQEHILLRRYRSAAFGHHRHSRSVSEEGHDRMASIWGSEAMARAR